MAGDYWDHVGVVRFAVEVWFLSWDLDEWDEVVVDALFDRVNYFTYSISGNILTITDEFGVTNIYRRVN